MKKLTMLVALDFSIPEEAENGTESLKPISKQGSTESVLFT